MNNVQEFSSPDGSAGVAAIPHLAEEVAPEIIHGPVLFQVLPELILERTGLAENTLEAAEVPLHIEGAPPTPDSFGLSALNMLANNI